MNARGRPKIVLLGMMTKIPVGGEIWSTMQYLIGLRRLGYDAYYVEAHARTPGMFMNDEGDDASALAASFLADIMRRFDFGDNWAFHALHDDGHCYGMSETQLRDLYRSAELIINFHGGTVPRPEHQLAGQLMLLETDPVRLEVELFKNMQHAIDFIAPHTSFFSWGQNFGNPDCRVPMPAQFTFQPTRAPLVIDFWRTDQPGGDTFTTIGNWRQRWRGIRFKGELYTWSKHFEFMKFLDLPDRTRQSFELALSRYGAEDQQLLEEHGWRVRPALDFSNDLEAYRRYIIGSRGEFTVAKDQNVRLRSGWFSERSAQYLAAGRPVITQDTGFGNVLPTGEGLFSFTTMDEILTAVEAINSDYPRHCRAAVEIAREFFSYDVVLGDMLEAVGLRAAA